MYKYLVLRAKNLEKLFYYIMKVVKSFTVYVFHINNCCIISNFTALLKFTRFTFLASGGYVIYRRRIWNKPQTLSDKCSNADSSGYIDDSTIRVSFFNCLRQFKYAQYTRINREVMASVQHMPVTQWLLQQVGPGLPNCFLTTFLKCIGIKS